MLIITLLTILLNRYMGTVNSSDNTKDRAQALSEKFGAYHSHLLIDDVVSAVLRVFKTLTGHSPMFKAHGGGWTEDLALQNIQARLRMVMSYLCAQLFPWVRQKTEGGKSNLILKS